MKNQKSQKVRYVEDYLEYFIYEPDKETPDVMGGLKEKINEEKDTVQK
jgi:hypothetical protein